MMRRDRNSRLSVEALETRAVPATYDLGVAADFNLFAFENVNARTSDVEGRVAVGNDASFYAYGIGDKLPNSMGTRDDLIVGNDLDFTYGQVYFGNIVYGNNGDLDSIGTPNGDVRQEADVIDFAAAETALSEMSTVLGAEIPNGRFRFNYSNLNLRGIHPDLNLFTLAPEDLAAAKSIHVLVPFGSTVVINVPGQAVSIQNLGLHLRGVDCSQLLWNFYQAEELTLSGIGIRGSILAPEAALSFNNGSIKGTAVVESMTGNGQFNLCPSEISIEIPDYANLKGLVFLDVDGDNQRGDPNVEQGYDGAEVILNGTDSLGRKLNRTDVSVNGGTFEFDRLWPGIYSVKVIPPQKYEQSQQLGIPGTVEGLPVGLGVANQVRSIVMGEGEDGIDYLLPLVPEPD